MRRRIIISALILTVILLLASCSSGGGDGGGWDASGSSSSSMSGSANTGGGTGGGGGGSPGGGGGSSIGDASDAVYAPSNSTESGLTQLPILTPQQAAGKKLIYTLSLRLQTTEFMLGIRTLQNTITNLGGYLMQASIDGRDMRNPDYERRGEYEFRIPTEKLEDLLVVVENNYNIWQLDQSGEDVTPRYNRAGISLEDLIEQEQRMISSLDTMEDGEDRLNTERMIGDIQRQISDFITYQITVDDSVAYVKVNVTLLEVIFREDEEPAPEPTFSERVNRRTVASIKSFVAFCQGFVLFLITIAPAIIIILIIAIVVLVVWRIYRRVQRGRNIPSSTQGKDSAPSESRNSTSLVSDSQSAKTPPETEAKSDDPNSMNTK